MTTPESHDLTQAAPAGQPVPQPEADRDRQDTLQAAANPSNTPVDDGPDPTLPDPTLPDPALPDPGADPAAG